MHGMWRIPLGVCGVEVIRIELPAIATRLRGLPVAGLHSMRWVVLLILRADISIWCRDAGLMIHVTLANLNRCKGCRIV